MGRKDFDETRRQEIAGRSVKSFSLFWLVCFCLHLKSYSIVAVSLSVARVTKVNNK